MIVFKYLAPLLKLIVLLPALILKPYLTGMSLFNIALEIAKFLFTDIHLANFAIESSSFGLNASCFAPNRTILLLFVSK